MITPKCLTVLVGYSVMPLDVKYEESSLICGSSYSLERGLALDELSSQTYRRVIACYFAVTNELHHSNLVAT